MAQEVLPRDLEVLVEAQVKHTESKDKVAQAVSNLFKNGDLRVEDDRIFFVSENVECLRFLKDQLRDRHVRAAARRLLLSNSEEGTFQTYLLLNKQAATAGVAALCDDPSESALGPIVLRIRSEHLQDVIIWLTYGFEGAETS
ncbi:MAG: hypothetical protein JRN52_16265 [Nitrososphaerota archaeon]|nr:hypothetical protein [Nitrososphaerota archaeon]